MAHLNYSDISDVEDISFPPTDACVGDFLYFKYRFGVTKCNTCGTKYPGFAHRFYTAPPGYGGKIVRKSESEVSLTSPIQVDRVSCSWWRDSYWVAVQFRNDDGKDLWTTYSKNGWEWLEQSEPLSLDSPRRP